MISRLIKRTRTYRELLDKKILDQKQIIESVNEQLRNATAFRLRVFPPGEYDIIPIVDEAGRVSFQVRMIR